MEPRIATGPMQKSSEAVRKPRTNLFDPSSSARENLFSRNSPSQRKPSSILHHSPSSVPIKIAPKTTSEFSVFRNICKPSAPVNSPIPAITVSFNFSGIREPKINPIMPPIRIAATLISVPVIVSNLAFQLPTQVKRVLSIDFDVLTHLTQCRPLFHRKDSKDTKRACFFAKKEETSRA